MKTKIAIVTGGSSGLGYEIAKILIQNNLNVCIVSRNREKLETAKKSLQDFNKSIEIIAVSGDVGLEENVKSIYNKLENYSINKLFNVAGIGLFGAPENNNQKMIEDVFEANLKGVILMSTYGLKFMTDDENYIVNVMSTAALVGRAEETVYCAAKWGARGYTEALKVATKGTKFKVVGIFPGGINTPFWTPDNGLHPDVLKFMKPYDVANKIVTPILNSDSSIITDITINRK